MEKGQKVVAICNHLQIVKDKVYTINNVRTCSCGSLKLDVGVGFLRAQNGTYCKCGCVTRNGTAWFRSDRFVPLQDIEEAATMVNELIEELIIKEHQLN